MQYNKTSGKEGILVSLLETIEGFGAKGFLNIFFMYP